MEYSYNKYKQYEQQRQNFSETSQIYCVCLTNLDHEPTFPPTADF